MAQYISGRAAARRRRRPRVQRQDGGGWSASVSGAAGVRVGTKLKGFACASAAGIAAETFVR